MSTVAAMASLSSSLNPDAPLFIPAAYRQVEDYSPQWWDLVNTTAWFRDHWVRQHQQHEAAFADAGNYEDDDFDVAALLPDDEVDLLLDTDDLFYAPPELHQDQDHLQQQQAAKLAPALLPGYDVDVLRALSLSSPMAAAVATAPSPRAQQQLMMQQQRHADNKPAHHYHHAGAARRVIHQPR